MTLLVATTNPDKRREITHLLAGAATAIVTLRDFPSVPEPTETGETFAENARLKAQYYDGQVAQSAVANGLARAPLLTVAEDSGLVIDALGGEPGVRSARFLGDDASYPSRFAEIERRLRLTPGTARTARFVCALAVVRQGRVVFETEGVIDGLIADAPRGGAGFGYDPIFYCPPVGKTLAEVDEPSKLAVAHRGHAFRALAAWLERHDLRA